MDRENGCNTEAKSAGAEFRRWADKMPATKTVKRQGRKDGRGNEQAKHEGMKLRLASRRGCSRAPPAAARTTNRTEAVIGSLEPHESALNA
jgi:hypothetical protein